MTLPGSDPLGDHCEGELGGFVSESRLQKLFDGFDLNVQNLVQLAFPNAIPRNSKYSAD